MNDEAAIRKNELRKFVPERVENTTYFKPNGRDWGKIERIKWSESYWAALGVLKENSNQPVRASMVWLGKNMIHFDVMRGGINKIFRKNGFHYRLQFTGDITSPTKMIVLHRVLSATMEVRKKHKKVKKNDNGSEDELDPKVKMILDQLERERRGRKRRKRKKKRELRPRNYFDIGMFLPDGEEVVRNTVGND